MTSNSRLDQIEKGNQIAMAEAERFREAFAAGRLTRHDQAQLKQEFPYFGVLPCRAAGIDFVLLHANDDVVAWEYLWFGADGYEKDVIETWVDWARDARLVYDIGGYTGLMATLAALASPDAIVHMWEPLDITLERARANVRLNGVGGRIKLHRAAASDTAGRVKINQYRRDDFLGTGTSIHEKDLPVVHTRMVRQVAIDDAHGDKSPDLVKIDVEGHELAVLRGLEQSVARGRPRMIIEVWEHDRAETLALLESWGYDCESFEEQEQRVMNFRCVPR